MNSLQNGLLYPPVSMHFGPAVLGDTSPKFVDANAATKLPLPGKLLSPLICFSILYEAYPLLSPDISWSTEYGKKENERTTKL